MVKGINQESIQKLNRVLIVKILQTHGSSTRADLARISNLGPATITNIINELISARIVKEEGTVSIARGRSGIALALDDSYYRIIGLRLSRKYFNIGTFDLAGNEQSSSTHYFDNDKSYYDLFEQVCEQVEQLIKSNQNTKIIAIGCAVPGPFLRKNGVESINSEFPDWSGIKIQERFEKQFKISTFIEHDANAGALAYYWKLSINPEKLLVYFSAGQGIGAGIVNNGKLILGSMGAAGEVGHMSIVKDGLLCKCGNTGCLEKYCSSFALTEKINQRINLGDHSTLEANSDFSTIADAIKEGDKLANIEYRKACDYLAIGVVNIINVLNPDIIVIGDEMAGVKPDMMQKRIEKALYEKINENICNNTNLYIEKESKDMILKGSAIVAIERLLSNTMAFKWVD